ncbi:MAG: peptide chain release factor N(5)-glutamine methyltransferase [Bacteroidota bacterium]
MLLKEVKTRFHEALTPQYPKQEVDAFFYRMVEHYCDLDRFALVLTPELTLTGQQTTQFLEGLSRLRKEEPLQHILGEAFFMGLPFLVNNQVLIPRPETEELVQWVLSSVPERQQALHILDIGTGSGCIAIALAKHYTNAEIYAWDISEKALEVAQENARTHGTDIRFACIDILSETNKRFAPSLFDIIIANPPYVREQEKQSMRNNVLRYEPPGALYVSDTEPLRFYHGIMDICKHHLKHKGQVFLEINQYLANDMEALLVTSGFKSATIRKDIFDNFRMAHGIKVIK